MCRADAALSGLLAAAGFSSRDTRYLLGDLVNRGLTRLPCCAA